MKKRKSPARKDPLLRNLAEIAGDDLVGTLQDARCDPRASRLLDMLLDPAYQNHSFGKICEKAGMSAGEVINLFRRHKIGEAVVTVAKHAPEIFEGIAKDALSSTSYCRRCDGQGEVLAAAEGESEPTWRTCPACKGAGEVRVVGDKDARRLALKLIGAIQ